MIVEYMYELGGRPQFLIVEENLDSSKFPEWVRNIVASGNVVRHLKSVPDKTSEKDKRFFNTHGYLEFVRFEKEYDES